MTNPAPATAARSVPAGGTDPAAAGHPPRPSAYAVSGTHGGDAVPPPGGPRPLHDAFDAAARRHPHADALVGYDGEPVSYRTLLAGVDAAARRLAPLGRPDVLGLAVDDPATFLACYLAAARLGLVAVLLDSRLSDEQLARSAERFDVSWLAVGRDRPGADRTADGTAHADEQESAEGVADGAPADDRPSAGFVLRPLPGRDARRARASEGYRPGDFVVHCTSGSTGEPKGIVMSQGAIAARVRLWGGDLRLTARDVVLCALPLDHCHGIDVLTLPALTAGATVVFARGSRLTGRGLARQILRHGVTVVSGLPVMYQMLTGAQAVPAGALASLRTVISGSAPLPVATQRLFTERFGIPLRQVYGLSEIGVICFDRDHLGGGSIGLPVSGVQWRLEEFADDGNGPGGEGGHGERLHELYVRGPALARGYYRDPAATAEMFQDGWLRTHDLLRADPDGWYVRGRLSGFVNVAGSKVSPLEVEAALRECPGVRDSAVAGVPGEDGSERVAALLVPAPGFDLAAVRRTLAARLLPHQLPQRYRTTGALPRTPLGKTDYAAVRAILRDAAQRPADGTVDATADATAEGTPPRTAHQAARGTAQDKGARDAR